MSTLVLDELFAGIVFPQPITIFKDMDCAFIRPWVYLHGTLADGELQCTIKDGAETLKVVTVGFAEINAAKVNQFAHGFLRIATHPLMLKVPDGQTSKDYTIEFEMINHTSDPSNFLGIIRSWESPLYTEDPASVNNTTAGCGFELYEFKEL